MISIEDMRRHKSARRHGFLRAAVEVLEQRQVLSASPLGVDALALADVNADQVPDLVVASHQNGDFVVTIYDGVGQHDTNSTTGVVALPLATITNPLGAGVGPLTVAAGDFDGNGVSDLAVAASSLSAKQIALVATYSFELVDKNASPLDQPVNPVVMAAPFAAPGFKVAQGLSLAAGRFTRYGADSLIVGPATGNVSVLDQLRFEKGVWQLASQINVSKQHMVGVNLSAGDVTGDGIDDLAVASQADGHINVLNGRTQRWSRSLKPLRRSVTGARVAIAENEHASGAIVETPGAPSNTAPAAILSWNHLRSHTFRPVTFPGAGALVPYGGGWVYQRSTIHSGKFPYSNGPNAPTVLFGATSGQSVVIQGFNSSLNPSKADTHVETVLGPNAASAPFVSLQVPDTFAETGQTAVDGSPLVAYPDITYVSPYHIDLSNDPTITAGLLSPAATFAPAGDGWGPALVANTPPTITSTTTATWLQQRVLAAYRSFIGVAYQHHHDPRWLPKQGALWNLVTIGYQSQGIDCTNFTAFAYADALGITMNSATQKQAAITSNSDITIPQSMTGAVNAQVLGPFASYDDMVSKLQPGDILFINPSKKVNDPLAPSDPSAVTHAITWLGAFGKDKNGKDKYLIIDSTVDKPPHIDSNNHVIKGGVHIRPFFRPNASTNNWYAGHVDHVLRLIAANPVPAPSA